MLTPPIDQANPFRNSSSLTLQTSHTNDMLDQRGESCQNAQNKLLLSLLVTTFVQACSLIALYLPGE